MPGNYSTVAMRWRKCYILSMSENTAYEQKELNMVISKPINHFSENMVESINHPRAVNTREFEATQAHS